MCMGKHFASVDIYIMQIERLRGRSHATVGEIVDNAALLVRNKRNTWYPYERFVYFHRKTNVNNQIINYNQIFAITISLHPSTRTRFLA